MTTTAPVTIPADIKTARGLTLDVYRNHRGDFTLNGISATHNQVTLVGTVDQYQWSETPVTPMPKESQVFAASDDAPAVALVDKGDTVNLVPVQWDDEEGTWRRINTWFMAGGNYAATADSRIGELIQKVTGHRFYGAIAIHDREER